MISKHSQINNFAGNNLICLTSFEIRARIHMKIYLTTEIISVGKMMKK
jgi:hypothetical protein